jgi:hypothetical protein
LYIPGNWDRLKDFINTASDDGDVGGARLERLKAIVNDLIKFSFLKLETAVTISIVCKKLIEVTYTLEGDGPCGIIAYECIMSGYNHLEDHVHEPGSFSESFDGNMQFLQQFMDSESCKDELLAAEYRGPPGPELPAQGVATVNQQLLPKKILKHTYTVWLLPCLPISRAISLTKKAPQNLLMILVCTSSVMWRARLQCEPSR